MDRVAVHEVHDECEYNYVKAFFQADFHSLKYFFFLFFFYNNFDIISSLHNTLIE